MAVAAGSPLPQVSVAMQTIATAAAYTATKRNRQDRTVRTWVADSSPKETLGWVGMVSAVRTLLPVVECLLANPRAKNPGP